LGIYEEMFVMGICDEGDGTDNREPAGKEGTLEVNTAAD
jgi:hypothetical protein